MLDQLSILLPREVDKDGDGELALEEFKPLEEFKLMLGL